MSITYGALSPSIGSGFTSVPWRAPEVANDGDLLLWWCVNKYPAAIPGTPTGHTLITRVTGGSGAEGVDVGEVLGSWYSKISDGTEAGTTETISVSGGNCAVSRALSFSRSAGSGWDVAFANASQATNENSWPLVTGDLDIAAGDMLVIGVSKNADNDLTHNYTVTATGVTFGGVVKTPTSPSGTTNGDDCAYHLAHVPVLTGSSTGPVSVTVAASGSGGNSAGAISVLRLREAGAGPAPVEFDGPVADATGVQNTALSIPLSSYFGGGLTPFAYSLASGTLPSGVTVDPDTGEVTGTPTVSGTFGGIVVKATDTGDNEASTNAFAVRLESNPTSDVGYYAIASAGNANYEHTTASHSFHHDGNWWTFLRSGANWNLYEESGNTPTAAGETVDWVGTPHLASVQVSQLCTVVVDTPRNKAYVLGFSSAAVTAVLVVLTYSGGSWSVTQTINVAGSSGVGLGSSSTFSNHEKLSLGVDPDGVPYIFAGNKGDSVSAANGCHLAWPDNAESLGGTWSYHTIDSSSFTTGDASGRFAGIISQDGTDYIVVCYTDDGATKTKLAYHQVETVRSNYTSGWTILDLETTLSVDNHVWAGVMNHGGETVVVTAIKNGDGAGAGQIHLFTSLLGPGMTWTHKRHQVTNGVAELGALQETPSRPSCVLDNSNGEVWVFFHARDSHPYKWVGYKKASLSALLAAAGPNDVFDISLSRNSEVAIYDASLNAAWNAKTPAHPVTSAMSYFPVTAAVAASGAAGDSVWHTTFDIAGVSGIYAQTGTYTQTGADAALEYGAVSGAFVLPADPGAYTQTGIAATLELEGVALTPKLRLNDVLRALPPSTTLFSGFAEIVVLDKAATRVIVHQADEVLIVDGVLELEHAAFDTPGAEFDVVVIVSDAVRGVFPATVVED